MQNNTIPDVGDRLFGPKKILQLFKQPAFRPALAHRPDSPEILELFDQQVRTLVFQGSQPSGQALRMVFKMGGFPAAARGLTARLKGRDQH